MQNLSFLTKRVEFKRQGSPHSERRQKDSKMN